MSFVFATPRKWIWRNWVALLVDFIEEVEWDWIEFISGFNTRRNDVVFFACFYRQTHKTEHSVCSWFEFCLFRISCTCFRSGSGHMFMRVHANNSHKNQWKIISMQSIHFIRFDWIGFEFEIKANQCIHSMLFFHSYRLRACSKCCMSVATSWHTNAACPTGDLFRFPLQLHKFVPQSQKMCVAQRHGMQMPPHRHRNASFFYFYYWQTSSCMQWFAVTRSMPYNSHSGSCTRCSYALIFALARAKCKIKNSILLFLLTQRKYATHTHIIIHSFRIYSIFYFSHYFCISFRMAKMINTI